MFVIKDKYDLRMAYEYLQVLQELDELERNNRIIERQAEIKREIRSYNHREVPFRIVIDEGMDGYTMLMELPTFLGSKEEAEEYFEANCTICATPSIFDCTGQAFTAWYKVFKRRNRFFAYHSVGFDF